MKTTKQQRDYTWIPILLGLILAIFLVSCDKDNPQPIQQQQSVQSSTIITKYYRDQSYALHCGETDTIKVYNRSNVITISSPILYYDCYNGVCGNIYEYSTPSFYKDDYISLPITIWGNVIITDSKLTISSHQVVDNQPATQCDNINIIYNRIY